MRVRYLQFQPCIIAVLISTCGLYPFPILLPIPVLSRVSKGSMGLHCHLTLSQDKNLNQVTSRQKKDLEIKCSGLSGICLFLVLAKKPVEVFMKGCRHVLQHYGFNKHYIMFKHNVLKWDAGSYSAFNCQKCLFLAWKDHASKESAVFNRQGLFCYWQKQRWNTRNFAH